MPNPKANQMERNVIEYNIIKDIRNLFRLKKKTNVIIGKITNGIAFSNNCIEYETNGDKNKTLSIEEYLNKLHHFSLT